MTDDRRDSYNPPVETDTTDLGSMDGGGGPLDTTLDTSRTGGMGGMAGTMDTTSDTTDTDMAGDNRTTDVTDL